MECIPGKEGFVCAVGI